MMQDFMRLVETADFLDTDSGAACLEVSSE